MIIEKKTSRVQLDAKVYKSFSEPIMMIIFSLQRFFRYHDHMFNKALHEKKRRSAVHVMPYGLIFKQCFPQCFNVFFTYFVTLTIFPAVLAGKHDKSGATLERVRCTRPEDRVPVLKTLDILICNKKHILIALECGNPNHS